MSIDNITDYCIASMIIIVVVAVFTGVILGEIGRSKGKDNCRQACPGMVQDCQTIGFWEKSGTVRCETVEGVRLIEFNKAK